jgi:hypothetical protein
MTKPQKRKDKRVDTALFVYLDKARGVTRDMSASGAYFWTSGDYAVGDPINFTIEMKTAGGKMLWKCRGDVIRTDPRDHMVGVAARITESEMEPASR